MTVEVPGRSVKDSTLLGVFARYWEPGQVKTRLAAKIGHQEAAALHRHFVESALLRLAGMADHQWLCLTPDLGIPRVAAECRAASGWRLVPQAGGSLGPRMKKFFESALAHASRVVLVGSDSPDLPLERIVEAFAALAHVPVVLGPADDGGYYLLGLARGGGLNDLAYLFDDIPWSTPQVFAKTLQRLESRGMECHLLPPWHDIDEWEDLVALGRRLSHQNAPVNGELAALSAAVGHLIMLHTAGTA